MLSRADVTRGASRAPTELAEDASACLESSRAVRMRAVVSFFSSLACDACARVMRAADTAALLSRVGLFDGAREHQVASRGAPARGCFTIRMRRAVYNCGRDASHSDCCLCCRRTRLSSLIHARAYVEHSMTSGCFARAS